MAAAVLFAGPASAAPSGGGAPIGPTAPTTTAPAGTGGTSGQLGLRVLRRGMRGTDVATLQGDLTLAGYPTAVDRRFGTQTKAAVIAFQRAHGLRANGVAGKLVISTLANAVKALQTGGPVQKAHINPDGTATAPASAPPAVKAVIAAANRIIDKPYLYAGGHASWNAPGYDCSGAVSYALHGGNLLSAPLAVQFEGYGLSGPGKWITVYADSQHVFAAIAGLAFDTADYGGPDIPAGTGPRWRYDPTGNLADGGNYTVRHPPGF
jgi:peptidoglycan hydrolase-like protein with peptidoglycan-binding domain